MYQPCDPLEQAFRAFGADLYRYAYWLCRDRFTAEDLLQAALERAWSARESLRDPSATKAWLTTIVRNEAARAWGGQDRNFSPLPADEADLPAVPSFEGMVELTDMLWSLPLVYREPLVLQSIGGFSCAEIGEILGLRSGAVMTRLTRARQALRRALSAPARGAERVRRL